MVNLPSNRKDYKKLLHRVIHHSICCLYMYVYIYNNICCLYCFAYARKASSWAKSGISHFMNKNSYFPHLIFFISKPNLKPAGPVLSKDMQTPFL